MAKEDQRTPEEIIETILGELGEVVSVVATDVELLVRWQRDLRVDLLANFDAENHGNSTNIRLGHLIGGSQETHEVMQEKCVKFNEKLDAKGKELEDLERGEFIELAGECEMNVLEPPRKDA